MDGSTIYDGCADILAFLENSNNSSWAPPSSSSLYGTMKMNFDQEPQLGVPSDPERNRCDTSMAALLRATSTEGLILGTRDVEEFGEEELDGNRHNQSDKKRRLTQAQVKSLEESFEEENKLEPERKVELAKKLGLQPRQVSIWFQNRRARYKSKQIEKEYDTLKANYDRLKEDYASLYKEMKSFKTEADYWKSKYEESVGNKTNSNLDIHVQLDEGVTCIGARGKENETGAIKVVIPSTMQAEDMSSAKSDIFDYESPQCMGGNQSSSLRMEATSSLPVEDFSSLPMEANSSLPVEAFPSLPVEASSTLMRNLDQQLKFSQDDEEQMIINNTLLLPQTPPTFNNFLNVVPEDVIYDPNANSCNFSLVDDQPTMWPWLY